MFVEMSYLGSYDVIRSVIGAGVIKYFENIFSAFNDSALHSIFSFLPEFLQDAVVAVAGLFVGDGWHLTLGALFVIVVVFLPGGIIEGITRIYERIITKKKINPMTSTEVQPGE